MAFRDVTVGRLLSLLAAEQPDREALVYSHQGLRWTFRELNDEARLVARGLMAQGVRPGDRVAVWATNVPEWIVLQFALAKIGAILVTVNTSLRAQRDRIPAAPERDLDARYHPRLPRRRLPRRAARRSAPSATAQPPRTVPASRARHLHRRRRCPDDLMPYAALRAAAAAVPTPRSTTPKSAVGLDDVINMQYTSGTTGFPKGVMLSSRNIVNNGYWLGAGPRLTRRRIGCACACRCFTASAASSACSAPTRTAPASARSSPSSARKVLETIERERCTALYGVPTMFLAELEDPGVRPLRPDVAADRHHGRRAVSRAADAAVIDSMHLPELTIVYGLTETSPGLTQTPRDANLDERTQTVGQVLPEIEVRIVDPATGEDVPTGERGELWARGYVVMKGYYNMPEQTAAAITADGWLRSGDQASIDADGNVRITGRIKDLIIRGGENIAPKEVEDVLRQHPAIADVVGLRHQQRVLRRGSGGGDSAASRRVDRRGGSDALLPGAAGAVQGAAPRPHRRRLPDDRVRQDSEVQAARAARSAKLDC